VGAHIKARVTSEQRVNRAVKNSQITVLDTTVGIIVSNFIAYSIFVTKSANLNSNGITDIQSSSQAAEALRPLAGELAFFLFSLGIIGTGLLAVPVLAGSAAYGVAETINGP